MPIEASPFVPARLLHGPHAQTLFAYFGPRPPPVATRSERLELPDGDFVDLAWTPPLVGPLVAVFHGLEGSVRSPYASGALTALHAAGLPAVLMHFRGCSGEPNRLARAYHSGDTADIRYLLDQLMARGQAATAAIGFSLGGNALLKYAAEQGTGCALRAVLAVSPALQPGAAATRMSIGASRIYQRYLLDKLKRGIKNKRALLRDHIDIASALRSSSFRQFDDRVTAPLHGFANADDYYARSASRPLLREIAVPTRILHSADDPFFSADMVPRADELGPQVTLELSEHGGHVGFVGPGGTPWLDQWIPSTLRRMGVHAG